MTTQQILQGVHDWTNGKIVYDISVAHPDGQGNPTKYATLAAALGTNGANIPDTIKKGGMSIKFVQSSDNKYVQYRYMSSSTAVANFTNVANWQGVDSTPTSGSKNLVTSGGVYGILGFQYMGVAATRTVPSEQSRIFYLALRPGTYTNFGNTVINSGQIGQFTKFNTTWNYDVFTITEFINDLTSGGKTKALTAEMGKTLNGIINDLRSLLFTPKSATIAEEGKYIQATGQVTAYNSYSIYSMAVSAGDVLYVTKHVIAQLAGLCFFDESDNYISGIDGTHRGLTENKPFTIVAPNNAVKCLLTGRTSAGIEARIANCSDGADLNILFSTFNKTIFEKTDEIVETLASSSISRKRKYTIYDFPCDGKLYIKYANTVGAVSKITVTVEKKNAEVITLATITPSTSYAVVDLSQYVDDIVFFGYNISSADITVTGNITVDIKMPSLLDVIKDIESAVLTLSTDITNTDTVDRLPEPTVSPIQRIERDFSFGAIFTSFGYVGDSLASGEYNCYKDGVAYHYDAYEYSWGQYLTRWLGVPGVNYTQGGMTAKSWLTNAAHGWPVAKDEPKNAYIIALGVNDTNNISVGNYTTDIDLANYENNADTFAGNYAGIIQRLKSISPRAKFFLLTMPKRNDDGTDPVWESYNVQIRAMASVFADVYVLDLYNFAPIFGGEWAVRYNNKFHLCAPGYLYLAFLISSYIDWIVRNNIQEFKEVGLYGTTYSITQTYKLSGVVTNNGNPVSDALVSVGHGKNWYYTKTSSDGSFIIYFLSDEYEINVHKSGLTDYSSSINITENTILNVQLNT